MFDFEGGLKKIFIIGLSLILIPVVNAIASNPRLVDVTSDKIIFLKYDPNNDVGNYREGNNNPNAGIKIDYDNACADLCNLSSPNTPADCEAALNGCDDVGTVKYVCVVYKMGKVQTAAGTCVQPTGVTWNQKGGSVTIDNTFPNTNKFPGLIYAVVSNDKDIETSADNQYIFIKRENGFLKGDAPNDENNLDPLHSFDVDAEFKRETGELIILVKSAYEEEGLLITEPGSAKLHIGISDIKDFNKPFLEEKFIDSGKTRLGEPLRLSVKNTPANEIFIYVNGFLEKNVLLGVGPEAYPNKDLYDGPKELSTNKTEREKDVASSQNNYSDTLKEVATGNIQQPKFNAILLFVTVFLLAVVYCVYMSKIKVKKK